MKIVDEVPGNPEDVVWVCGSHMPPDESPLRAMAMWDKCKYCRTPVVHAKDVPDGVLFLCMTCAQLECQGRGEEPEIVMRAKDKEVFEKMHGKGTFEELNRHATDILTGRSNP